jgi:hypothetical protein
METAPSPTYVTDFLNWRGGLLEKPGKTGISADVTGRIDAAGR